MADAIGFRRSYGVLVPYFNAAVESELASLCPPGVSNQTARFALDADVLDNVNAAARGLGTAGVDALLIGFSTESIPGGVEMLRAAAADVGRLVNRPVFTATDATLAAVNAIGADRVAVVTPFDDGANAHVREVFRENEIEVTAIEGLAHADIATIGQVTADTIRALFARIDHSGARAVVQIGTGLALLRLLDELEADFGKPVIACNAALYWQALRATGIDDAIAGHGALLRRY